MKSCFQIRARNICSRNIDIRNVKSNYGMELRALISFPHWISKLAFYSNIFRSTYCTFFYSIVNSAPIECLRVSFLNQPCSYGLVFPCSLVEPDCDILARSKVRILGYSQQELLIWNCYSRAIGSTVQQCNFSTKGSCPGDWQSMRTLVEWHDVVFDV